MRLTKLRRHHSLAFNMTPMIDIVFLLIIFFMTVSQITRTADSPVELPVVAHGTRASESAEITINLDLQGLILISGQKLELDDCIAAIERRVTAKGADVSQVSIQLRVDKACDSGHVNRLVERLAQLGFVQVNVAVVEE